MTVLDDMGEDMSVLDAMDQGHVLGEVYIVPAVCTCEFISSATWHTPPIQAGCNTRIECQCREVIEGITNMMICSAVSMTKLCVPADLSTFLYTQSLPDLEFGSGCCSQRQSAICYHGFRAVGHVTKDRAVSCTSEEEQSCRCCSCSRWRRAFQHSEDLPTALFGHSGLLLVSQLCLCCMLW